MNRMPGGWGGGGLGFGLVRCTRGIRKKSTRLLLLDGSEKPTLEDLPQDVLIRILCHVQHGDLKHLVRFCKTIKEATVVAKQCHFAYTTPTKIRAFRNSTNLQNPMDQKRRFVHGN
ncbi:F-box domain-containing protein [Psidium guajava]|nr:F-box domain-containing protein [Psidium guajava]